MEPRKPVQESLERGSDAIRKGTVEIEAQSRRYHVRYKTLAGYANRKDFPKTAAGQEEANAYFWRCVDALRIEVESARR